MQEIRPAAVAGMFYPGAPRQLTADMRAYLAATNASADAAGCPKALIVPHAGYVYSGPVAANAFARLAPGRDAIRRVVLLGPCHRVPVRGLALPAAAAFATPLGNVAVDREAVQRARALPQVVESAAAHRLEHSLEVQLPFLQSVLTEFSIVPFAALAMLAGRRCGGDRVAVGRSRHVDPRQLGPFPLPPVRRSAPDRPRDGGLGARAQQFAGSRTGLRRDSDQWFCALRAAACPFTGAARFAQFGRYCRRQVTGGRLRRVRVLRGRRACVMTCSVRRW